MADTYYPKDVFLASLDRCLASPGFLDRFYDRFLESHEEVKRKFATTDFKQQHQMIERSLRLVAAATIGEQAGLAELHHRAITHSREHMDIRPELYRFWLTAIIETASESDPEWSDEVCETWRDTLGYAVAYMTHRY